MKETMAAAGMAEAAMVVHETAKVLDSADDAESQPEIVPSKVKPREKAVIAWTAPESGQLQLDTKHDLTSSLLCLSNSSETCDPATTIDPANNNELLAKQEIACGANGSLGDIKTDGETSSQSEGKAKTKCELKNKLLKKRVQKAEDSRSCTPSDDGKDDLKESISDSGSSQPSGDMPSPPLPVGSPSHDVILDAPVQSSTLPQVSGDQQYMLGDMFWGKVSGHPWWPCMIANDPYHGICYKLIEKKRSCNQYHVQFFGQEGERGWVMTTRLLEYKGTENMLKWLAEKIAKNPKDKKNYEVGARRRPAWDIACQEAEAAFPMSHPDRLQKFALTYDVSKSGRATDKRLAKRKLKRDSLSPKHKKQRRQSNQLKTTPESSSNSADVDNKDPLIAGFRSFCDKHRDALRRKHPTYSDEQLDYMLVAEWDKLPEEEKSVLASAAPSEQEQAATSASVPDSPLDGGKRHSKPSVKLIESHETGSPRRKRKSCSPSGKSDNSPNKEQLDDISGNKTDDDTEKNSVLKLEFTSSTDETGENNHPGPLPEVNVDKGNQSEEKSEGTNNEDISKDKGTSSQKKQNSSESQPQPEKTQEASTEYEPEVYRLSEAGTCKKEPVCGKCESAEGSLMLCQGPCVSHFHANCVDTEGQLPAVQDFKCSECTSGKHQCFVCKESQPETKRCDFSGCGKFYHEACVSGLHLTRMEKNWFYCPLHTCATCAAANCKNPKAHKGKMYRCVRCPTAFHTGDLCLAAGSMPLGGTAVVCSRHFEPIKSTTYHTHVNVSWCFLCSKGGHLLCCETCPAAFHPDCLQIDPPEEAWFCRDCASGKRPLYGDIVWVKLGTYRWWPAEIYHPRNVPTNIQEKPHQVGEFPVRFFGSHDYFWLHQARVFLFQDGDKGCKENTSKGLAKIFNKALEEAAQVYKLWKEFHEKKEEKLQEANDRKPAPYKHIKVNLPVGDVVNYKVDLSDLSSCDCNPNVDEPCGPDTECINRLTQYECHPAVCPAKDRCCNQRFQKREYPPCEPFKCENNRGWGLRAKTDIERGQFVQEYVGELIDMEECRKRIRRAHDDDISNFYMLTLDSSRIIDAGPKGNYSRFMNHSCQPNCDTQIWTVNGDRRVGLFANQFIPAGKELTFNYNLDSLGNEKKPCFCGAPTCSGFIGARPKQSQPASGERRSEKKRKRRRNRGERVHEDECFRCGEGGDLIMCDKTTCTKVYHLACLTLDKRPYGKWLCPWHHCDECGGRAVKLCSECPNSFCGQHLQNNIYSVKKSKTSRMVLVCNDHSDLLKNVVTKDAVSKPRAEDNRSNMSSPSQLSRNDDTSSQSHSSQNENCETTSTTNSDTSFNQTNLPEAKINGFTMEVLNDTVVSKKGKRKSKDSQSDLNMSLALKKANKKALVNSKETNTNSAKLPTKVFHETQEKITKSSTKNQKGTPKREPAAVHSEESSGSGKLVIDTDK